MITTASDALHKSWLNRILIEVADTEQLANNLVFKGGTCASMLGYLDRFSVDLDFDLIPQADAQQCQQLLRSVFTHLDLHIKNAAPDAPFFVVGYPNPSGERSTVKLSVSTQTYQANQTQTSHFTEIDRYIVHQNLATMFAHKLVAVTDRFAKYQSLAGRDVYDMHHFFMSNQNYLGAVIEERTGQTVKGYLLNLIEFIEEHFSQTTIDQDINLLVSPEKFRQIRKVLLPETLALLKIEAQALSHCR